MFTMYLLISMILALSSAMILSMNPLSLGVVILVTALVLTLSYSMMLTSWIAFLIFLIYVGGMLVMFAYFVALTPNQQSNELMLIPAMMILILTTIISYAQDKMETIPMETVKNMNTFYLINNIQLLLMLAMILLFTMIVVVKLVTNNKGPLRPFMKYV